MCRCFSRAGFDLNSANHGTISVRLKPITPHCTTCPASSLSKVCFTFVMDSASLGSGNSNLEFQMVNNYGNIQQINHLEFSSSSKS